MRLKALAEIYTIHSFAQLLESKIENCGKKDLAKTTSKRIAQLCNFNFCQRFAKQFAKFGKISILKNSQFFDNILAFFKEKM